MKIRLSGPRIFQFQEAKSRRYLLCLIMSNYTPTTASGVTGLQELFLQYEGANKNIPKQ